VKDRSQAESGLSGALGILLEGADQISGQHERALVIELKELNAKIKMAIAIHVDAVNRTTMVRAKPIIRLFRLAGNAPEPVVYEFEDDVL
jgi:cytochrome b